MLLLGPRWKVACVTLQVLPLPGLGAVIAGHKNPHTKLRARGIAQLSLVVFGSWPLIIPGAAGVVWAWWDAFVMARTAVAPGPMSQPAE